MTPLEINKAIAEHLGWKWKPKGDKYGPLVHPWIAPDKSRQPSIPNYHGDLNAMAVAEATLSHDEQLEYAELITSNLSEEFCDLAGTREHVFACATFTAAQRAEAFLRVKGLWKETTT